MSQWYALVLESDPSGGRSTRGEARARTLDRGAVARRGGRARRGGALHARRARGSRTGGRSRHRSREARRCTFRPCWPRPSGSRRARRAGYRTGRREDRRPPGRRARPPALGAAGKWCRPASAGSRALWADATDGRRTAWLTREPAVLPSLGLPRGGCRKPVTRRTGEAFERADTTCLCLSPMASGASQRFFVAAEPARSLKTQQRETSRPLAGVSLRGE